MTDKAYEAAAREIHYAKDCHRDWFNGVKNCDCWDAAKAGVDAFLAASPDLYRLGGENIRELEKASKQWRMAKIAPSHVWRVGEEPVTREMHDPSSGIKRVSRAVGEEPE